MMVPEEISLLVSSNPYAGASNVSKDGSYFEIQLQDGLKIPKDALNVNISVEETAIWWTVPNIITGENDKLHITGPDTNDITQTAVIVIPQGLYDLSGLNQAVLRELEQAGFKTDPDPLITLTPDEATQKVELRFNYLTVSVDFTQPDTFREMLGFNAQVYTTPIAPETILAPNVAAFNTVNYFLVHSDLTNQGIRFNNDYNQTVSQVLIDVSPGSQIVSRPFNPAKVSAQELTGTTRTNLRFWLTDDKNRRVNTNGEYWTARIVIRYLRPFVIARV